jgi:hypothetical protein
MRPHYVRIWADAAGESHLEDVTLPTVPTPSSTSHVVAALTEPLPAVSVAFRRVIEEDDTPHCAPRRQLLVYLEGEIELTVSDGSSRILGPGSVLLLEDVAGKGHAVRSLDGTRRLTMVVPLE